MPTASECEETIAIAAQWCAPVSCGEEHSSIRSGTRILLRLHRDGTQLLALLNELAKALLAISLDNQANIGNLFMGRSTNGRSDSEIFLPKSSWSHLDDDDAASLKSQLGLLDHGHIKGLIKDISDIVSAFADGIAAPRCWTAKRDDGIVSFCPQWYEMFTINQLVAIPTKLGAMIEMKMNSAVVQPKLPEGGRMQLLNGHLCCVHPLTDGQYQVCKQFGEALRSAGLTFR